MVGTKKERTAAESSEAPSISWLLGSSEPVEGDHAGNWPAVENYLRELFEIHSSRAGRPETSYYGPLETLLNEIGKTLKPRVRCVMALKNQGAGFPDGGLFTADQLCRAADDIPLLDHIPASGVIEAEGTGADALEEADSEQVRRYWERYRLVLVTTFRDFVLVGEDAEGNRTKLESYQLADSEPDFWAAAAHPRTTAREHGERLTEYLRRVLLYRARIQAPEDVARILASYARDARVRVAGGPAGPGRRPHGAGRGAGHPLRGPQGRPLLPFYPGADPLLRHLLRVGPVEQATPSAEERGALCLA